MVQCVKLHPAYDAILAAEKCWAHDDREAETRADLVFNLLVMGKHVDVEGIVAEKYVPAIPRHLQA